jgi:hypothetical protein
MRLPWVGTTYATLAPMTRAEQLIAAVQQSGFPHLDSLIHLFVGGSELHCGWRQPLVHPADAANRVYQKD